MSDRIGIARREIEKRLKRDRIARLKDGEKDYDTPCSNCDAVPTVHPTGLCGQCCFGEADTANGNW